MKKIGSEWETIKRIASQAAPHMPLLCLILLASLLFTPITLLQPVPLKIVIDSVLGPHPLPPLVAWAIPPGMEPSFEVKLGVAIYLLIIVALLQNFLSVSNSILQTFVGERMIATFRADLFRHAQSLSLMYHDSKGSSESVYRIQYDAPSLQYVIIHGVIPIVGSATSLFSMVYVVGQIDSSLAIAGMAIAPILFVLTRVFRKPLKESWINIKKLEATINSATQEVLSSMRLVKIFGREEYEHLQFSKRTARRIKELMRVSLMQGLFEILTGLTVASGTALVLYIGVRHVQSGLITLGSLLLVLGYVGQLFRPLDEISDGLAKLQGHFASLERAFELLDEMPEVKERPGAVPIARAKGSVRFSNVSFGYDKERLILKDVNFEVPAGSRVGIEGKTGAGKSTLISLLMRFYDVDGGQITVDDMDIRGYKLADYRNQFAVVLQDTVLFSTTIAENIAYGCPDKSESEIIEAARLANAHEFIMDLPLGYETLVGERGMRLSGGERQRIALARAFLKDAPILILDEPTSSVDVNTETTIIEALQRLMSGRTTFMIAHRLSTLESCEIRLRMKRGRLEPLASIKHSH